ncbi:transporter substrate-binding domain-containing protein [Colwellia sp. 12G3]|uniref:transporter substrate-binding domain-containing protein n=1 Tax=Colwellia sp. 12G3 TaxID=2058299 RepID=UPI000C338669|nr:transporter substrate-binding domain-containing protein [Colwellia sp. 12G3]PKI17074.1 hypothetical protein CXF71_07535 [Colwellia sp. 12G3]
MRSRYIVLFMLFFVTVSSVSQAKDIIYYPWFDEGQFKEDAYYIALLKLALESSKEEFGEYQLQKAIQPMYQGRSLVEIKYNRNVSVTWTMTSKEREIAVNPIRIPLLRGLGGYRIFLIKQGQQDKFSQIKTAKQLKKLFAGQGYDWPDSTILTDNNYRLITGPGHKTLFNMLQHGRFDYMPRALHEAWNEVEIFEGLQVESSLALHYPSPYYFFVSNDNPKLKSRIEVGLRKAEKNGSFKKLFDSHPVTKNMLASAKLGQRKVFKLNNRFMSSETQQVVEKIALFHSFLN